MNCSFLSSCLRMLSGLFLVALVALVMNASALQAQCNTTGCDSILVRVTECILPCPAPITKFVCNNGAQVNPQSSPYTTGTETMEPCPCQSGLAAIIVGTTQINVGSASTVTMGLCCWYYNVQVNPMTGCAMVSISLCPGETCVM